MQGCGLHRRVATGGVHALKQCVLVQLSPTCSHSLQSAVDDPRDECAEILESGSVQLLFAYMCLWKVWQTTLHV